MQKSLMTWLACGLFAVAHSVAASEPIVVSDAIERPPESFAELLAGFKEMTGLEARFEEEKTLALLAAPLHSSGRLYFSPPSTLLRRVETPRRQDILIDADQVRISDDSGEQIIDLAGRTGVRPLIESMIWIFTGNLDSLEGSYRIEYQVLNGGVGREGEDGGEAGPRWEVRLTPKDDLLSQLVTELRVSGSGRSADLMELVESTGDRTRTRIIDADTHRQFDAGERRELFARP